MHRSLLGLRWVTTLALTGHWAVLTRACTHTHACSRPHSTVQTVGVHSEHCYQSCLQVLQRKLQRRSGPDTNTRNTQTGHMQQRLVLRANYNLGSAKTPVSISEHLRCDTCTRGGVYTHTMETAKTRTKQEKW